MQAKSAACWHSVVQPLYLIGDATTVRQRRRHGICTMHAIHRYTSNVGGVTTGQVRHNSSLANEIAFCSYFQTGKRDCLVFHEKAALRVVSNIM